MENSPCNNIKNNVENSPCNNIENNVEISPYYGWKVENWECGDILHVMAEMLI